MAETNMVPIKTSNGKSLAPRFGFLDDFEARWNASGVDHGLRSGAPRRRVRSVPSRGRPSPGHRGWTCTKRTMLSSSRLSCRV
jgi:hypothetical protein